MDTILIINYPGADSTVRTAQINYPGSDSTVRTLRIKFPGVDAMMNLEDELIGEIEVNPCCTPENPFYVRWINRLGGFDYWMFQKNQIYEQSVKTLTTVNPVVDDILNANYLEKEIDKEASRTISVGSGNLSNIEYNELLTLSTSPRVEYWDEEIQKWIRIYVASGKFESETWHIKKEIEIEFTLPTLQMQF